MYDLYIDLLTQFIKFKSIATDPSYNPEIMNVVEWLEDLFEAHDFRVKVIDGYSNPIILATYCPKSKTKLQTCLVYGHYDVQPANASEGWNSDPFTLDQKNGRLYARGVADNKGQTLIHIVAIFDLIKKNELGYNIIYLLEGGEEIGSPNIGEFIKDYKNELNGDFCIISDGTFIGNNPVIEAGFRGFINLTLAIKTSSKDLHSGIFGGAAPNASHELTKFISTLFSKDNKIAIKNFYNDVDIIEEKILQNNKNIPFSFKEYRRTSGTKALVTRGKYDFYSQTGLQPTIEITGIQSGYTKEGYRNSIPGKAVAKINFRLVKNQKPQKIIKLFKDHLKKNLPNYVDYSLDISTACEGVKLDINNKYVEKAKQLLRQVWKKHPVYKYVGGGLATVTTIDNILKVPQLLIPLANEDCNPHGANENFVITQIKKSMEFSRKFFNLD